MNNSLNENIKKLRRNSGFSQVELAKILGVSKQCVSNWENDNVLPSIEMLVKIADYFSVTTDWLLGRTSESTMDARGLTDAQSAHLRLLINDFRKLNR